MFIKKLVRKITPFLPEFIRPLPYFVYVWLAVSNVRIKELLNKEHNVDIPLPSPSLRFRVHARPDARTFLDVGATCGQNIRDALALIDREIYSFDAILDFGCGCGRVLRHFQDVPDYCHLYGTDIDGKAISWCQKNIRFATFCKNEPLPPLIYPAGTFDLVFAISVFTHLDEDYQLAWLKELQRITKPNAVLILTTENARGAIAQSMLTAEDITTLEQKGFLYKVVTTGRLKPDGLPDFYQLAFHNKQYVIETWSKYFLIHTYLERGIGDNQDLVLLQKV